MRIQKEIDRARGTHALEMTEREACQDMEKKRASEGYPLPEDSRGRDPSEDRKKATK